MMFRPSRRLARVFPLFVAPALLALPACSGDDDDDQTPEDVYATPTPSPNAGNEFNLNGTFAGMHQISQYVQNAFNPNKFDLQTVTTYSIVTMTGHEDGTSATWVEQDCITDLTEVSGSATTLDEGFYEHAGIPYTVTVSEAIIGGTFTMEEQVEIKGAELSDPWNEALPVDPEDARVRDWDGDGDPGYTIAVDGAINGWIWACERYIFSLNGTLDDKDSISGLLDASLTDSLMETSSILIPDDTEIRKDEEPSHSFFKLKRVESTYSCDDLIDARTTFFD